MRCRGPRLPTLEGRLGFEHLRAQLMPDAPLLLGLAPPQDEGATPGWATSIDEQGSPVLFAFTSLMEAAAFEPGLGARPVAIRDLLEGALRENFSALVIDPAGPTGVVDRAEMQHVLRG